MRACSLNVMLNIILSVWQVLLGVVLVTKNFTKTASQAFKTAACELSIFKQIGLLYSQFRQS